MVGSHLSGDPKHHGFADTGMTNGVFSPIYGNPQLEPSYFSWMVNQPPAMRGRPLDATITAIKQVKGAQISKPQGINPIPMLTMPDGRKVFAGTKEFLDFQHDLADHLEKFDRSPMTPIAVTGDGFVRDFSKLRTHAERVMNPSSSPNLKEIGVGDRPMNPDYLRVQRLLTELYTEVWSPVSIRQNNKSHGGLLCPTTDKATKILTYQKIILEHNIRFVEALADYDSEFFTNNFGTAPVTFITYRVQLDALGKVRKGYDSLGWYHEELDKSIDPNDTFGHVMNAARMRNAYAVDGMSNAIVQPVWAGWRENALKAYHASWHTSVDEDIINPIKKYGHFRSYDAVQFDTTFTRELIDHIIDSTLNTTDLFKRYMNVLSRLPIVIKSDFNDQAFAYLFNNITYAAAHQSGLANVSDLNKIRGSGDWIYGLHLVGHFSFEEDDDTLKERYRTLLKHEDPMFAFLNQGDDTIPFSASELRLDEWCNAVAGIPWTTWEEEDTKKYLGRVIYQAAPGAPLKLISDEATLVEKLILNEHGMHTKHRPLASLGNLMRIAELKKIPGGYKILDVLDLVFRKHFGHTPEDLFRKTLEYDADPELSSVLSQSALNTATREFLHNPDVIHYKYSIDEIDPRVVQYYFEGISAEDAAHAVRSCGLMNPDAHEALQPRYEDGSPLYKFTGVNEMLNKIMR